ncbi:MAG: bifunctional diguanylate cyclase/phosphodiesterase [Humidesulfovibrio sp.]|uniref:GGDEF domain-containing protein n=1 Tax=Humidesulfovibrio sp. TaxID=2910988 RepID=UPI0027FCDD3E|nr:bifunctional diguanylate cyclase/phosphodiesterase [Humidesulfovibrio sp.]MDQ7835835.1 bifunctional diguanylate cyclase/phosphodiesterase [Humidesulfovibrio sp.]
MLSTIMHKLRNGRQAFGGNAPNPELRANRLRELVRTGQDFDILLINVRDFPLLRELYGQELSQDVEAQVTSVLKRAVTERLHVSPFCLTLEPGEYLLGWPSQDIGQGDSATAQHDAAYEIKLIAQREANTHLLRWAGRELDLGFGCARHSASNGQDRESKLFQAVNEARLRAKMRLDLSQLSLSTEFNAILHNRSVRAVFQPIADFATGTILAWEALTRGPEGTTFQSPAMLFDFAEQSGKLFALERLCREKAISTCGSIGPGQKLFLNIHPKTMADPEFTHGMTLELLQAAGLTPQNIVFEITERHSITEFALFHRTLDHYRSQGYLVAVDDAGAGYSGLTSIAQIRPEFIKIDMSLIQGIDKDPVKRALIETFVTFADKIGSKIIAEGIESQAQAACLVDIGVHYGQGYYLARPDAPKPPLLLDTSYLRSTQDQTRLTTSCLMPIGNLVEAAQVRPSGMLVPDAQQCFETLRQQASIVVADGDRPLGLVMEYQLNRQLSGQFGSALYSKRTIDAIMDKSPLIVDEATPVEQTAKAAMLREKIKAYDDIIVTRQNRVLGIVTVQRLLNALAHVQVEMAKGTNPLTGLPGNVTLEREVESLVAAGKGFAIAYADLDNFKVYNDTYGFKNGDRVIKLSAEMLDHSVRRYGDATAKLFHIGGDDFVLVSRPEHVERICQSATRCFKRLIRGCYCQEDRKRGEVQATGRDGVERTYPLVSLSIGILEIAGPCTLMEIGERAAQVKKIAKAKPGNGYVWDRRAPLGSVPVATVTQSSCAGHDSAAA